MFNIERYYQALGVGQVPRRHGEFQSGIADRNEAVHIIEEHVQPFAVHGYDDEQDYWWYRNKDDHWNQILVIRPADIEAKPDGA